MYRHELKLAKAAAMRAATYLEGLTTLTVDSLSGKDIKLEADRESEKLIIDTLEVSNLPIIAEESGCIGIQEGLRWIIDPLDGTYNFFRGIRELSCVSVALWDGPTPILGVILRLGLHQVFEGNVPAGCACINGERVHSSSVSTATQAAFATGFPVYMNYSAESLQLYIKSAQYFKKIRMLGSAALMSASVGAGYVDVYSEKNIKLWDIASGTAFTLAAGGVLHMDLLENSLCNIILCANQELLSQVTALLADTTLDMVE